MAKHQHVRLRNASAHRRAKGGRARECMRRRRWATAWALCSDGPPRPLGVNVDGSSAHGPLPPRK
eukprot:3059933-Pleurochrysis_carterae.AAC.1